MTRELRNAVSRLRKLQDAAYEGKIDSCMCCMVDLDIYNHHYGDHDHSSVTVTVVKIDDNDNDSRMHWSMYDDICEIVGAEDDTMTHKELLEEIARFIDYPV